MPSLAPQGTTIANLRRAIGYTQVELALRVGVSERTVRNAERGVSIKRDFLKFIANGLGVSVADLTAPAAEEDVPSRWRHNADRLLKAVGRAIAGHDSSALVALADQNVTFRREGCVPGLAFGRQLFGEFHGASELSQFLAASREFWQACGDVDYYVEPPTGGGDVVVLRYGHEVPLQHGGYGWTRSVVVCEFAVDRLMRAESYVVPGDGPPERGVLPAPYSKLADRRASVTPSKLGYFA